MGFCVIKEITVCAVHKMDLDSVNLEARKLVFWEYSDGVDWHSDGGKGLEFEVYLGGHSCLLDQWLDVWDEGGCLCDCPDDWLGCWVMLRP